MTQNDGTFPLPPHARRPRRFRRAALGAGALAVVASGVLQIQPAPAAAREPSIVLPQEILGDDAQPATTGLGQSRVLAYPMEFVWPTAMRYLRVDRGYAIVDRDADAGFILFDFPIGPEDRTGRGSVEIFATKDASGRAAASVQITTDGGPVHLPHALLDGLAEKLRRERGQPAAPPRAEPPPDGGPGAKGKDKQKPRQKPRPNDEQELDPEDLPILD
jgi:hypothetical protein